MAIKYKWLEQKLEEYIYRNLEKGLSKLPTEEELCKHYGVSRQTVRLALSLLEEKGFITRKQGSGSFVTGRLEQNNRIAVLLQGEQEYPYPFLINSLQQEISKLGFTVDFYSSERSFAKEKENLQKIQENPYRGLIAEATKSTFPSPNLEEYHKLLDSSTRIVFMNHFYPELSTIPHVKMDYLQGTTLLVRQLFSKGHTNIAGLFRSDDRIGLEIFQGYCAALKGLNLPLTDEQLLFCTSEELTNLQVGEGSETLRKKLQKIFLSCSALICPNDEIAHFIYRMVRTSFPDFAQEYELACFHSSYLYEEDIRILSLSTRETSIAAKAVEALFQSMKGFPVISEEYPFSL